MTVVLDQTQYLKGKMLAAATVALNFAVFTAFVDLMAVSSLMPAISESLHAEKTITWAMTAMLDGAVVGQCVFGYLSDIFTRRAMLLWALCLYAIGALGCALCSLRENTVAFFVLRAMIGIATGSITNLVNIAQFDYVPPERRGTFQGFQGPSFFAAAVVGLLSAPALAQIRREDSQPGWTGLYYLEGSLAVVAAVLVGICLPSKESSPKAPRIWHLLKTVDWLGILFGAAAVIPATTVIKEGDRFGWNSPTVIGLGCMSGFCALVFVILGCMDRGLRPIVPFRLFRNPRVAITYAVNFFVGFAYDDMLCFMPLYLVLARGKSPLVAGALMVPFVTTHGLQLFASGAMVDWLTKRGHESIPYFMLFGSVLGTASMAVLGGVDTKLPTWVNIMLTVVFGLGTGSIMQTSVTAIRNEVSAEDAAVAIGSRNVIGFLGGSIGTAVGSQLVQWRLQARLPSHLHSFADYVFARPDLSELAPKDQGLAQNATSGSLKTVFLASCAVFGLCVILCTQLVLKSRTKDIWQGLRSVTASGAGTPQPRRSVEDMRDGEPAKTNHAEP